MKTGPILIGAAVIGAVSYLLWPKKAKAASLPPKGNGKPTSADATIIVDDETGGVFPAAPAVPVEAVQVAAEATKPNISIGPGRVTVPIPGNVVVRPVEPTTGETVTLENVTTKTPGIWQQPETLLGADPLSLGPNRPGVESVPELPTKVFPGDAAELPDTLPTDILDQIVIETPEINASADALSGSAAATVPGMVDAIQQVFDTALGGVTLPSPKNIPADSIALLRELLAAEGSAGWKRQLESVRVWQGKRGLKPDAKFGPLSSAQMFGECGMTALVRYWPSSQTKQAALATYASAINAIAASRGTQAGAAIVLGREKAQAYGVTPKAQEVLSWQP